MQLEINSEKLNYTEEQEEIVKGRFKPGSIVKVNAFAGTGKTFTLKEFSKRNISKNILYVAFNKSIQLEAQKKFSKNVLTKTAHSLAFYKFGNGLKHKLSFNDLKPLVIAEKLNTSNNYEAMLVYETTKNFIQSSDEKISDSNFPNIDEGFLKSKHIQKDCIVSYSKKLWKMMIDPEVEDIQATHDTYLKLYQLSKPKLNYNYILLDEAQDTSHCVFDIIMNQKNAVKLFVGDEHQSIYGWRGAVNAMEKIDADHCFNLTNSFRFIQKIANHSNTILNNLKETSVDIVGKGGTVGDGTHCYIARTNSGVFQMAIESEAKLYFVGGLNGYRFTGIYDVYYLWKNEREKIRNPFILMFESYEEYKMYGDELQDVDIMSNCGLIENYGSSLPSLIAKIKMRTVEDQKDAQLILTTAHKSKGCEWDSVQLAPDFKPIFDIEEPSKLNEKLLKEPEEINLMYVSITRSRGEILLNDELSRFIRKYSC